MDDYVIGESPSELSAKIGRLESVIQSQASQHVAFRDIVAERKRQDEQWGGGWAGHEPMQWIGYIQYEASLDGAERDDPIRERFVRIAAIAVAAIESMDREAQ